MAKSRVSTYLWLESFERLKALSEQTKRPMTELLAEAIELLAQHEAEDRDDARALAEARAEPGLRPYEEVRQELGL
jgi:predicted DNA-binding protein